MCAIVDANSWSEVFSQKRPPAGKAFYHWLTKQAGSIVLGGRLRAEVSTGHERKQQIQQLQLSGILVPVPDEPVFVEDRALKKGGSWQSNDTHILALARVSGARLLYSKDGALHKDFTNPHLLARGKVYSTQRDQRFTPAHRRLLMENQCPRV